jgi:SAM-dependent methyltransferase
MNRDEADQASSAAERRVQRIVFWLNAGVVHAFDLDPDMVGRARRRLSKYPPDRLRLFVGDAAAIEAEDETYDAVFDFGIIHHVPDWRRAVSEVARVLRPGGRFFFEEVTSHALSRWSYKTFLEHPREDRFSAEGFVAELERPGILVGGNYVERFFGDFVFGVGRRAASEHQPVTGQKLIKGVIRDGYQTSGLPRRRTRL